MPTNRLALLRREIDRLNTDILDRIQQRAGVVLEIAELKKSQGLERRDPAREAAMLDRLTTETAGPFSEAEIRMIFQAIFDASLALMERQGQVVSSDRSYDGETLVAAAGLPLEEGPHAG